MASPRLAAIPARDANTAQDLRVLAWGYSPAEAGVLVARNREHGPGAGALSLVAEVGWSGWSGVRLAGPLQLVDAEGCHEIGPNQGLFGVRAIRSDCRLFAVESGWVSAAG
jgi:hypothetical protein